MKPQFAFFGTPEFATIILDELEMRGFTPDVVVTAPDAPKGRKLLVTPSAVSLWATSRNIPILTPKTLKDENFTTQLKSYQCNLFIVAAYGKIIPKEILDIPKFGALNVHPSLLPKFRGSSPVESVILSEETSTGVTIILLDTEVDHGPIVAQHEQIINNWPPKGSALTRDLAHLGGVLLAEIIINKLNCLAAQKQDHTRATFTKKIIKEDGLVDFRDDPYLNYKKIRAYDEWPGAYFFTERGGKQIRVRITDATYNNSKLTITRITPEGKKEMSYEDFFREMK